MKTIFIEHVSNGWIVHEHLPCPNLHQAPIAVFNRMIDLQTALPELLEADAKLMSPMEFVKVGGESRTGAELQDMLDHIRDSAGGDRRPETIGGSELCPSS